jgi:DNA-binding response OmpR family regulator
MIVRARICLIDDDNLVRDAMALGLSDAGYDIVPAASAAAGFDIVERDVIHAIVTDLNMPGTTGAQHIAEARARWPHMVIVAISGAAQIDGRSTQDLAGEQGADATLLKPFKVRQLTALIEQLLAARLSVR